MRGTDQQQVHVFSYISPEQRVRKDHPLRPIRTIVDKVLKELSPEFNKMYSKVGRPSIPPEQLLRALLLQMLYSVRSERLLIEEIDTNILFRWFVGLNLDDAVWDATVFTKNRDRLLEAEVAKDFLALVVEQARGQGRAPDEHFTVDGSLLEAWASAKSCQPKNKKSSPPPDDPGNPTVDLWTAGCGKPPARPERYAALEMLQEIPGTGRVTVGGDKGFDTVDFVRECRNIRVTPHVAQTLDEEAAAPLMVAPSGRGAMSSAKRKGSASKNVLVG